jgi:molecular chaperone DnaJ
VETGVTFRVRGGDGQENLIIRVQVLNDRIFRREGADVHVDVPISISQAVLGGQVQVPTLTGDVVLKIRPGTQPGQMQVMRGKGIKMLDSNQYGDQYVHINVIIPMNISQRQQRLMQDFAREENRDGSNVATGSG